MMIRLGVATVLTSSPIGYSPFRALSVFQNGDTPLIAEIPLWSVKIIIGYVRHYFMFNYQDPFRAKNIKDRYD